MSEFLAVIVVALAAYRLARAVAVDTISDRPRAWLYERAFYVPQLEAVDESIDWDDVARGVIPHPRERIAPEVQTRSTVAAYAYGLISCAFCAGWWISLALWVFWAGWHPSRVYFVEMVAVAGAQAIFAAKGTTP
jgi:hypothetical protein